MKQTIKLFIYSLLGMFILLGTVSCSTNIKDYFNKNYEYTGKIEDNNVHITKYLGNETKIKIPEFVVSIGASTFYSCKSLTSVEIPNSVTSIGYSAFAHCINLKNINIPNSVSILGENTFNGCNNLTIYCETESQPSEWDFYWNIANRPVYWGISKTDIIEKNGVQYIIQDNEAKVTRYIGNEANVKILSTIKKDGETYNVTSIGDSAFVSCVSLKSIVIPNSITSIEMFAFVACSSLKNIVISDSVINVGGSAFLGCNSLTIYCEVTSQPRAWDSNWNFSIRPVYWGVSKEDIIEKNGVQYIVQYKEAIVTRYIGNDSNVKILSTIKKDGATYNVTNIGSSAFEGGSILKSVVIPNGVKSIGFCAFYNCNNLKSVKISNSVTSIGANAFKYCSNLTSINIPNSIQSIEYNAFCSCESLTSVVIPNSVTSIGEWAFTYCSSLTIYCEAKSKPSGWDSDWNYSDRPVYWGVNSEELNGNV